MSKRLTSVLSMYISTFFSFLTTLVFAKYLGEEVYAYIALGIASGSILQLLVNFGMDKSLLRDLSFKGEDDSVSYLLSDVVSFRCFIFALVLVFFAFIFSLGFFGIISVANLSLLLLYSLFHLMIGLYPKGGFEFYEKIYVQNNILMLERLVVFLIVALYFYFSFKISLLSLLVGLIVIRISSIAMQYSLIDLSFTSLSLSPVAFDISRQMRKGFFITIALLANSLIYYGIQFTVPMFYDFSELSAIGIALQFCLVVTVAQTQVLRHLNKTIIDDRSMSALSLHLFKMAIFSIPLALFYLLAVFLCKELYLDTGYENLYSHALILSVWLIFLGPGLVINQYIISKNLDKNYLQISVTSALISIALCFLLSKYTIINLVMLSLLFAHTVSMYRQYLLLRNESEKISQ